MSSSVPPSGPPGDPQGPEYLEQGGGGPLPSVPRAPRAGGSRGTRVALVAGGVLLLGAVGGGVWALSSFLSTGPQPAEMLPDSTIAYASIDLDPSGQQKIEAVRTLRKFPSFREEIGLDTDDDVRRAIWEESGVEAECDGVSYDEDVEPWLGDRGAVAGVDTGEDTPTPVAVLQVTDEDAAEEGLAALFACTAGESDDAEGGWVISDGWAVIAETDEIAQGVVDDAGEGSLADDATYQRWTGEVGDAGIVNAYVAPAAGEFMADGLQDLGGLFGPSMDEASATSYEDGGVVVEDQMSEQTSPEVVPDEVDQALRDFEGMAMTVRFDDGAFELEMAGDPGVTDQSFYTTDRGADMVQTLPEDTAVALGVGFADGWLTDLLDRVSAYTGEDLSVDLADVESLTGLDLPDDVETLFGESFALSVDGSFDPEQFFSTPDPSGLPVAAKVEGDATGIEGVLDTLRRQLPPSESELLASDAEGDVVVFGPSADYNGQVLADGGLGDSDVFQNVVREADQAGAVFYVNFDAGDDWLADLVDQGDPEAAEDVDVLEGFGASAWSTDDASHAVLRLTTDD